MSLPESEIRQAARELSKKSGLDIDTCVDILETILSTYSASTSNMFKTAPASSSYWRAFAEAERKQMVERRNIEIGLTPDGDLPS